MRSSRNAITHGVFCRDLLVLDENQAELEQLKESALRRMCPRDAVEQQLVEQWVGNCWKLKRLQGAEKRAFDDLAKFIRRSNDLDVRVNGRSPSELIEPDPAMLMCRLIEKETLEKYQRYQQRLFSNMLRCSRELRMLQKEDVDPIEDAPTFDDLAAPNEPTADDLPIAQNEATEASAAPKSSINQCLPPALTQPLTPRAAKLMAAVDATVRQTATLNLKTAG